MTRTRRHGLVAVLLGVTALSLTACSSAPVNEPYEPAEGVMAQSGQIRVLNALVVTPAKGGDGVLLMTVANLGDQPEELTGLATSTGAVEYTGSKRIPGGQTVHFSAGTDPSVIIRGGTAKPGQLIRIRVEFAGTEPINLVTPVYASTGDYATVTPAATPAAQPSDTATPPGSSSPGPIASPSTS